MPFQLFWGDQVKTVLKMGGLAAACIVLPACATVTRGSSQAFVVETDPPGADVKLSNGLSCKTPCSVKVKRKDGFVVKITKDGYQPVEATIQSQMSGAGGAALAGNVILGGLIGAGVDAATGATKELKPNPLKVSLEPVATASAATATPVPTTAQAAPEPLAGTAPSTVETPAEPAAAGPADDVSSAPNGGMADAGEAALQAMQAAAGNQAD